MAIVRWRPNHEVTTLQDEMNRLLESFFGRSSLAEPETAGVMWGPKVDIHETEDGFVVEAELPGLTKEDIRLSVHESTLTVEGEKRLEREEKKGKNWHRQERTYGKFQRVFTLPRAVDPERISATFRDGVLVIELPKSEAARPKEIPISIK
ncbi:MAG: Hsp20/alpha crystallin family protein [Candidatus Eisenbacteria bacterium]|nr:Hsp20/alpha crystallin family protein [Candidatus Eisenbacteria bacterium]